MEVDGAIDRTRPRRSGLTTKHWLALIVLAGAVLRFYPIWFGLPFGAARPDEETAIAHALAILGGDPNPHFFDWPSLTFYLLAIWFGIAGWIRSLFDVHAQFTVNDHFIIARAMIALAGTLTIGVLFRLARRMTGEVTALVASFFLAVATLHVRESHFAMTDALMTLLAVTSLTVLLGAFRTATGDDNGWARAVRGFAVAGLLAGFAASTKYSAAALMASIATAQLLLVVRLDGRNRRWLIWMPAAAFAVAFAAGFALTTPYAILDHPSFAAGLSFDWSHLAEGHGVDLGPGWRYHATRSLPAGVSLPVCVAAVLGVTPLLKRDLEASLIVGAFGIALYGGMATGHTVFFRYMLPLVPLLCLWAAAGVTWIAERLANRAQAAPAMVTWAVAAVVGLPALVNSVRFDRLLAQTDTRVMARQWLADHVGPDDSLYDGGGRYARVSLAGVPGHLWKIETFDAASKSFRDAGGRIPDWLVLPRSPLQYTDIAPELRQLAEERYELATLLPASVEPDTGVYDLQDAFFLPVAGFGATLRPGPTVAIYRRR